MFKLTNFQCFLLAVVSLLFFNIGAFRWSKSPSRGKMIMSVAPRTYVPLLLTEPLTKKKNTLLVKNGDKEILKEIEGWGKKSVDKDRIEEWTREGKAFWLTPQGTRAIHNVEATISKTTSTREDFPSPFPADFFMNVAKEGTDEIKLISATQRYPLADLSTGVVDTKTLASRGEFFTNLTAFYEDRRIVNRAESIAIKIRDEFDPKTNEYKTYTEKLDQYNATSLSQVFSTYFRDYSAGDVGGKNADYIPKKGYTGTLAPGEKFIDTLPNDQLPKKVLHPWPAVQEFQFHVRYPPSHPMIPPPVLWFALNNMYKDSLVNLTLSQPEGEVVGGSFMSPRDAIRIANFMTFGRSYDPEVQVPHGGSIFKGGHNLPNYAPDFGPTVPEEVADAPLPEHIKIFVERWNDPFLFLNTTPLAESSYTSDIELLEEQTEEQLRKEAAKKMMASMGITGDIDAEEEEETVDPLLLEDNIKDMLGGKTRSRQSLIAYNIKTMRALRDEILATENDYALADTSGRRKKKDASADVDMTENASEDFGGGGGEEDVGGAFFE